ncbi:hypothetical protein EDM53_00015 [Rickettsiales endosymbiont of Peranema trichophorum]|uniref:HdaA/DnaA family protein n=1 Tax=Rickettsiales endosymbiont of Peranema trichophorum TaxID=2486577 RepID=UPI0010234F89|nr:DnaA/Hda family protein [Rickettsiales endosymbiont of Peranema trichophorum]RZI47768.1 hypothetical protein EDM53_00015 [Rickettsiales endosymbiont of Peranema trichophorum]
MVLTQRTFDFVNEQNTTRDSFIVTCCNLEAYRHVTNYGTWPNNRTLIIGPEKSGKSHLAKIFADNTAAEYIDLSALDMTALSDAPAWILEDIDKTKEQEKLFYAINIAVEQSIVLLLTATCIPSFSLKDLQSRINASNKVLIKSPDDDMLKALLLKHFRDQQLLISDDVLDYIFTRTERSFGYISSLVQALDKYSLSEKRNITVPLVRDVVNTYLVKENVTENNHTNASIPSLPILLP